MTTAHASRRSFTAALLTLVVPVAHLASQVSPAPLTACAGAVADERGAPIAAAQVTFTPIGDAGAPIATRTTADGRFRVPCPILPGGYAVRVSHVGFASQFRDLATPPSDTIRIDFVLKAVAQQLAPVQTTGSRPIARIGTNVEPRTPGADVVTIDLSAAATGDPMGDLQSALALIPELALTPDGSLAFGAGQNQGITTLNGMAHAGALPRDGLKASVTLSTYDPRLGHFAGAQVSYTLASGTETVRRSLHLTAQDPPAQWPASDPDRFAGAPMRNVLSGAASGPIRGDHAFYAAAIQLERRQTSVAPLDVASRELLARLQLDPDSIARLLGVARTIGLPVAAGRQAQTLTSGSFATRIDLTPNTLITAPSTDRAADQLYLLASGGWSSTTAGLTPTSLASHATASRHDDGQLMADYVTYRVPGAANESKLSLSFADDVRQPAGTLPAGVALVDSRNADGVTGLVPVTLGGAAGAGSMHVRDLTVQGTTSFTWYTWSRTHLLNLFGDLAAESYRSRQTGGNGTFAYASVSDLANGLPSTFDRTLGSAASVIPAVRAAIGLGDTYSIGARVLSTAPLTLQYGVRVDGERYGSSAVANADVARLYGLHTDRLPHSVAVEPMAGFTWNFSNYRVPIAEGAYAINHRNSLSGGVREYRGLLALSTLASVAQQTGLASGLTTLRCIGDAVPSPDWRGYATGDDAIPDACVGPASSLLSQRSPSVAAFADGYRPAERWSGQLKWTHEFTPFWIGTVGGTLTRVAHAGDAQDVNFNAVQRFTLASESARPVYVSPASIIPATGAVSTLESRRSPGYVRVTELTSDASSRQAQASAGIAYNFGASQLISEVSGLPSVSGRIGISYAIATGSDARRGFAATTDGDPRTPSSAPQPTPRHTVITTLRLQRPTWWTVHVTARLSSGLAFTPLVGSDINGDGYANDRAFIPTPAQLRDSAVQRGMTSLLASAPGSTRACLEAQLGRIAAANSCRGAWSASVGTIGLTIDSYRLHIGPRGSLSLFVVNALSAVDAAVNGAQHLRGWGQVEWSNPVLFTVRGFDPHTDAYQYSVNPQFGTTPGAQHANLAPASLVADLRLDVGPAPESEMMRVLIGHMSPDERRDSLAVKRSLLKLAGLIGHDLETIAANRDSLGLSAEQTARLGLVTVRLGRIRDSVYSSLASFLATHSATLGDADVRRRWHSAGIALAQAVFDAGRQTHDLLREEQLARVRARGGTPSLWYTQDWLERQSRAPIVVLR